MHLNELKPKLRIFLSFVFMLLAVAVYSQDLDKSWRFLINYCPDSWYKTEQAKSIADNVLLYQRENGGWPKNVQMHRTLSKSEEIKLLKKKGTNTGATTDNGATTQEMLFLSNIYRHHPEKRYKESFLKGLDYLLEAQYDNGGWPQFYPLRKGYYSHITYNDDSMVNIMKLLQNIKNQTDYYSIDVPKTTIEKARLAFEKGVECIINTQYVQNGTLTAWCAQHDEHTLLPTKARAYELPSLSGAESAEIVLLLMSIDKPSEEVKAAIHAAVNWFEEVKITGLREERIYNSEGRRIDKKMILDENAPAIWARFMDLETNKPFFSDRDGIKKDSISQIGVERRNGYAWYKTSPQKVLNKYPLWLKEHDRKELKKPNDEYNVVVAKDGSGDYTSIQEAINNSKSFPYKRVVINVKDGVYKEKVKVHEWNTKISLIGESKEHTIITYDDYFGKLEMGRNSTFFTYTLLVEADDFMAKNLTIENSSGEVGQAVALSVFSDRVAIINCRLLGNQDTLYASGTGKQLYRDCYIEGTTDFIFGGGTAFFENCTIHSKKNSYITAASTPEGSEFGYVFKNCKLTAENEVSEVYLGRPWRIYAQTVFINCHLGSHILPEGWHNWSKPEAEKTTLYAEFYNQGAGFKPKKRVSWSHQLSEVAAKKYNLKRVLGEYDESSEKKEWYEVF